MWKTGFLNPERKYSLIAVTLVCAFAIWLAGNLGAFGLNKITYDVISYHSYGPALFIQKDLKLDFYKDHADQYNQNGMYFANYTNDGKPVIKTTYGLSLMYLPFTAWPFLFLDHQGLTGYELPFSIAISISNLFYFVLGMFLLRHYLIKCKFEERAVSLTLLIIGLGTNLLSYASLGLGMPHAYNFFLITCLLNLIPKWHSQQRISTSILIGLCFGLLVLIRPTNIVFGLMLFLFRDKSNSLLKWFSAPFIIHSLTIGFTAFLVLLPQLLYWHYATGNYLHYSYEGERFYFDHPHLLEYLFGFRKGWFVYTPLILIGLIGFLQSIRSNAFGLSGIIIIIILIFLNSSWWCWWFGGGHGARAMIETYPLIAFGFAYFIQHVKWKARIVTFILCFMILFNIKSVDLFRANIIHFDSMTPKAFFYTTFKLFFSEEDKAYLKTLYRAPDYEAAMHGEKEIQN